MLQFRRIIRLFLLIAGAIAGIIVFCAAYFLRMLLSPPRQRLSATPDDLGMPFEDVQFPARDGVRLSGWFVPVKKAVSDTKGTVVIVHGWPWNRLGTSAENIFTDVPGSAPVQLIHLAHALHRLGYQLLMFDLRNHGRSAGAIPVTFGLHEANDLLGALDYLSDRQDVNQRRIGVVGFSTGANTVLYTLPRTDMIRAAVAVQPTSMSVSSKRYARSLLGPLGKYVLSLTGLLYQSISGFTYFSTSVFMIFLSERMTSRSTTLCNSLTLPLQL